MKNTKPRSNSIEYNSLTKKKPTKQAKVAESEDEDEYFIEDDDASLDRYSDSYSAKNRSISQGPESRILKDLTPEEEENYHDEEDESYPAERFMK